MRLCVTCGAENPDVARFCLRAVRRWPPTRRRGRAPDRHRHLRRPRRLHRAGRAARSGRRARGARRRTTTASGARSSRSAAWSRSSSATRSWASSARRSRTATTPSARCAPRSSSATASASSRDGDLQIRDRGQHRRGRRVARRAAGARRIDGRRRRRQHRGAPAGGRAGQRHRRRRGDLPRDARRRSSTSRPSRWSRKGRQHPVEAWVAVRALTAAGERPTRDRADRRPRRARCALLRAIWERVVARAAAAPRLDLRPGRGRQVDASSREFARRGRGRGARVVRGRSLPYRESGAYGALARAGHAARRVFESDAPDVVAEKLREPVDGAPRRPRCGSDAGRRAPRRDRRASTRGDDAPIATRSSPRRAVPRGCGARAADDPRLRGHPLGGRQPARPDRALARGLRGLPLLLVTLARPELLDARDRAGAAGSPATRALTLGPLAEDEHARELARPQARRTPTGRRGVRSRRATRSSSSSSPRRSAETASAQPADERPRRSSPRASTRCRARERALLLDAAVVGKVFWHGALAR